jgi:hypothetical protein
MSGRDRRGANVSSLGAQNSAMTVMVRVKRTQTPKRTAALIVCHFPDRICQRSRSDFRRRAPASSRTGLGDKFDWNSEKWNGPKLDMRFEFLEAGVAWPYLTGASKVFSMFHGGQFLTPLAAWPSDPPLLRAVLADRTRSVRRKTLVKQQNQGSLDQPGLLRR